MSKKNIANEILDNEVVNESVDVAEGTVMAYLVKEEDGYHVVSMDGTKGDVCKIDKNDCIMLTPNEANRQWFNRAKADKIFDTGVDKIELGFKATRTISSSGPKLPNEKLISYLPEAEQEEYRAIIARAIAARDADKKPKTEAEKKADQLAKLKAKIAALEEELGVNTLDENA